MKGDATTRYVLLLLGVCVITAAVGGTKWVEVSPEVLGLIEIVSVGLIGFLTGEKVSDGQGRDKPLNRDYYEGAGCTCGDAEQDLPEPEFGGKG